MKHFLGLFILCVPFLSFAGSSKTSLVLRGFVPVSYHIDVRVNAKGPVVKISSNLPHQRKNQGLKVDVSKVKNYRIIAFTQP